MAKLNFVTKVTYATGQIAINAKDVLFHYFFLFFFNSVLGISALLVGVANLIALFVDALTDPIMGSISDGWKSKKWGRRHLFMAVGALPLGFGIWMLFSPPAGLSTTLLFLWMIGFSILVRLALTLFFVPYLALSAELTNDYDERTNLTMLRTVFGNIATIILAGIIFSVFLANTAEFPDGRFNPLGYAKASLLAGVVATIAVIIAVSGTFSQNPNLHKNEHVATDKKWWVGYREFINAFQNRAFRAVTLGFTNFSIMAGFATALTTYLLTYFWGLSQTQSLAAIAVMGIAIIPGAWLGPFLAKKIDKKKTILSCLIVYISFYVVPITLRLVGLMPANGTDMLFFSILFIYFVGQALVIAIMIISESMMADVSDEYELQTGQRQEGILFAGAMFARKMSFAVGGFLASIVLKLIAFPVQTTPQDIAPGALFNFGAAFVPTIFILLVFAWFCFNDYPVTRESHAETLRQLKRA